jgi:hypothetical protein
MSGLPSLFSGARRRGGGAAPPPAVSPIGIRHLITEANNVDGTSFSSSSITPGANRLVIASVLLSIGSGNTPTPTMTGNGLSWVMINSTPAGGRTIYMFRSMGAAPTTGPITISTGSTSVSSCGWTVTDFSNVVTTGTSGSGAVVAANIVNQRYSGSSFTSVSTPFPQAIGANNATYAAIGINDGFTVTPDVAWNALGEVTYTSPASDLISMAAVAGTSSIDASWFGAASAYVLGIEIDNVA